MNLFFQGIQNEFEIAVNEPSVFEPLIIYCIRGFGFVGKDA